MDIQEFKEICVNYAKGQIDPWYLFYSIRDLLDNSCTNWTKNADRKYNKSFDQCSDLITFKNPEKQLYYDWDCGLAYLIVTPEFKCGFYFDYSSKEFNPPYILDFDDKENNRVKQSFNDISALCLLANELTQNKYSDLFNKLSSLNKKIKLEECLKIYKDLQIVRDENGYSIYSYNGQNIRYYDNGENSWLI